jgi:hypothetical protein
MIPRPWFLAATGLAAVIVLAAVWLARSHSESVSTEQVSVAIRNQVNQPPAPNDSQAPVSPFAFTDVAKTEGVDFSYFVGGFGEFWFPETTGGGAALFDFDGDGAIDLFLVNGCQLPRNSADSSHISQLYRSGCDGTFHRVTELAGCAANGYGQGCAVGDFDNDGFEDLYITNYGQNKLYHNCGDGSFVDVTETSATGCSSWSTSAAFADLDGDGDLELYVCTYTDFDPVLKSPWCVLPTLPERGYCAPNQFSGLPDVLYRNDGDGTFSDCSASADVALSDGKGLGVVAADFDLDGMIDLYVANDGVPSFLFHNEGGLMFKDIAPEVGAALNGAGRSPANMGVACGDYDRNGLLDLYVSTFFMEPGLLLKNLGAKGFVDATHSAGLAGATMASTGWGTQWVDFDNDGWLDLFIANGHVVDDRVGEIPYAMWPQLFRNTGARKMSDVSRGSGAYFMDRWNGRGAAFGDWDNDGLVDVVVVHRHQPVALLHNDTKSAGHFLGLELRGKQTVRDAVGARVVAELPNGTGGTPPIYATVVGGSSYLSASDRRITLGVGDARSIDRLQIHWPSGLEQRWEAIVTDRWLSIEEGSEPRVISHAPRNRSDENL